MSHLLLSQLYLTYFLLHFLLTLLTSLFASSITLTLFHLFKDFHRSFLYPPLQSPVIFLFIPHNHYKNSSFCLTCLHLSLFLYFNLLIFFNISHPLQRKSRNKKSEGKCILQLSGNILSSNSFFELSSESADGQQGF